MNEEKRLNEYHWVVFEIAYFVGNPIAKKYWGGGETKVPHPQL